MAKVTKGARKKWWITSLWMDHPFMGLIHHNPEDPLLDLSLDEDLPLDLSPDMMKTYCGMHEEGPTMGWSHERIY